MSGFSRTVGSESSPRAWYRSLYWRIGIGFVVFLAAVLAIQGLTLVWLISRMEVAPGPPPPEVARLAARDLGDALSANPGLDIEAFLRQEYGSRQPLVAVMRDGRVIASDGSSRRADAVEQARARFAADPESFLRMGRGRGGRGPGPRSERGDPERGRGPGGGFLGAPGRRTGPPGLIIANGELLGLVMANPRSPWRQLGPPLIFVGIALLAIGTVSASWLIFGPARSRLRSLEIAARQLGAGDVTARAREDGGDEVAAVAHTFNRMAVDLKERAEQLQEADRTRRLLLADVSHELMTPLTAMRGYLETLSMRTDLDTETRERYLSVIADETGRVEHIVRDLLDLARLEGGGDRLERQDVPVESLFGRVVARHEREAVEKRIAFATSIGSGAEIVTGDPMRLEQALQNLAANALRHTPSGGRIELGAEVKDSDIVIVVRDSGSGIAAEHLPHIFDRFYKAEPSRTPRQARDRAPRPAGSGLGLSIVKAIIERHGGQIAAESRPGEGTWFTIRLPHEPV